MHWNDPCFLKIKMTVVDIFHSEQAVCKQIADHKPNSRGRSSEGTIKGKGPHWTNNKNKHALSHFFLSLYLSFYSISLSLPSLYFS